LAVIDVHSLGIHTVILLPLLSFSVDMTVSPMASLLRRLHDEPELRALVDRGDEARELVDDRAGEGPAMRSEFSKVLDCISFSMLHLCIEEETISR
jgi:hypothetical protein